MTAAERSAVVAAGRSWLGVPFRHCGRSRLGIDCFGHLVLVSREAGCPVHDTPRRPYSTFVTDLYDRYLRGRAMVPVPVLSLLPGDWLLMGDPRAAFGTHTALWAGGGAVVHACPVAGRVIEVPADATLMLRVKSGLRFKELAAAEAGGV